MRTFFRAVLGVLTLAALSAPARAATIIWNGAGADNNWSTGANWAGGVVPGAADNAQFDGTSTKNCTIDVNVSVSSITINSGYTGTITASNGITIALSLAFAQNAGTVNLAGSQVTVSGNWLLGLGGSFNAQTSTVTFNGTQTLTGSTTFYNLIFNGDGKTQMISSGSTMTALGTLTLDGGGSTPSHQDTINGGGLQALGNIVQTVNAGGGSTDFIIAGTANQTLTGNAGIAGKLPSVTINKSAGTLNLSGSIQTAQNWTNNNAGGTVLALAGSSVTFTGSAIQTLTGSTTFYNLIFNGSGKIQTISSGSTMTALGTLTLDGGGSTPGLQDTINGGGLQALGNIVQTANAGGGTASLLISGSNVQTYTQSGGNTLSGPWTLAKTGGELDLASPLSLNAAGQSLTIAQGILDLKGNTLTVNSAITNSGELRFTGQAVSPVPANLGGSTITYNNASGTLTIFSTWTYRNLVFNGPGATFNAPASGLTINESLTVSGGTLTTTSMNYLISVTSNVSISGGVLNLNASTVSLSGNWAFTSGTFNAGTSTVTLTGASASTLTGSSAFYGLSCVTPGKTLFFSAGSTQTVSYLTLTGASGNLILVRSTSAGSQAYFNNVSFNNVSYVDAQDNNASAGVTIRDVLGGVNSGNNVNWTFPPPGVLSFSPPANTCGVSVSTLVVVNFGKSMSTPTFNNGFSLVGVLDNNGNPINQSISGAFSFSNSSMTMTFTPSSLLAKSNIFQVQITTNVQDIFNEPLGSSVTWRFSTLFDHTLANVLQNPSGQGPQITIPAGDFGVDGFICPSTGVSNSMIQAANQKLLAMDSFKNPIQTMALTAFDAVGNPIQPAAPVTLQASYLAQNGVVTGTNPPVRDTTLAVYMLDSTGPLWIRLPGGAVNQQAKTVTTSIPHFSFFALIGAQDTSLGNVFAYPVPYVPSRQATRVITFANLSSTAKIRIFTISGDLVRTIDATDGTGKATWDVKNSQGQDVASGLYIYVIENAVEKTKGELVVVR